MEVIVVTRYRCKFCRRTFASKSYTLGHELRCSHNPASRTCSTCVHFSRQPCCAGPNPHCGCGGLNTCDQEAFVMVFDSTGHLYPEDWRRGCPMWEARQ